MSLLGDTFTAVSKFNPSDLFSGSTANPSGRLGSVAYNILPLSSQLGIAPRLERAFLQAKDKYLPNWLNLSISIDNPKKELGKKIPLHVVGKGGEYASTDAIEGIMSRAKSFMKPTHYRVSLSSPAGLPNLIHYMKNVNFSVSACSLPGKALSTFDARNGTPNMIKLPYDIIYDEVKMTFQVDEIMNELYVFETWMDYIYNKNTKSFQFASNFWSDIHILQLTNSLSKAKEIRLIDAYPTNVSEIALSYDAYDTIETFEVSFAYREWETVA